MTDWLPVTERSAVAEARRRARAVCDAAGLGASEAERAALVATEAATNLVRHAERGRMAFEPDPTAPQGGAPSLTIVAADRGPGIADLDRMGRDGVSGAGSSGTGLGAIRRQSDRLDIQTGPQGTILASRISSRSGVAGTGPLAMGALMDHYPGAEVCGDGWAVRRDADAWTVTVCDGLGHGRGAHEATEAVLARFMAVADTPPAETLAQMSEAARPTRGAVAMVVRVPDSGDGMTVAGIGNVSGLVAARGGVRRLISRDGRLGGAMPRLAAVEEGLAPGETLILHSDGLRTLRDLDARRALLARAPLTIAATLLRDDARGNDDACVLVARRHREDRG